MQNKYDDLNFLIQTLYNFIYGGDKEKYMFQILSPKDITLSQIKKPPEYDGKEIFQDPDIALVKKMNKNLIFKKKNCHIKIGVYSQENLKKNDLTRGENVDKIMMLLLSELVATGKTPYITLPLMNFDVKNVNMLKKYPIDQKIKDLKKEKGKIFVSVTECFFEHLFLKDYLQKHSMKKIDWQILFFQVLQVLYAIQKKWNSFRHNQFTLEHLGIYLKDEPIQKFQIGNYQFYLPVHKFSIRLFDFEQAVIPDVVINNSTDLNFLNPYYDFHTFLFSLSNFYDHHLPNEIINFYQTVVPKEFFENNIIKKLDESKYLSLPISNNLRPLNILIKNSFFTDFRNKMEKHHMKKIKNEFESSVHSLTENDIDDTRKMMAKKKKQIIPDNGKERHEDTYILKGGKRKMKNKDEKLLAKKESKVIPYSNEKELAQILKEKGIARDEVPNLSKKSDAFANFFGINKDQKSYFEGLVYPNNTSHQGQIKDVGKLPFIIPPNPQNLPLYDNSGAQAPPPEQTLEEKLGINYQKGGDGQELAEESPNEVKAKLDPEPQEKEFAPPPRINPLKTREETKIEGIKKYEKNIYKKSFDKKKTDYQTRTGYGKPLLDLKLYNQDETGTGSKKPYEYPLGMPIQYPFNAPKYFGYHPNVMDMPTALYHQALSIPYHQYTINVTDPWASHTTLAHGIEDALPQIKSSDTFNSMGERLKIRDFIRSVLVRINDGERIDMSIQGKDSLFSRIKFLELNPYSIPELQGNPYKNLPFGMIIYRTGYPVRFNPYTGQTTFANNSTVINVRIYHMSEAEYFINQQQEHNYTDSELWREISFYEYMRQNINKTKSVPNFAMLHMYGIWDDCKIQFDALAKMSSNMNTRQVANQRMIKSQIPYASNFRYSFRGPSGLQVNNPSTLLKHYPSSLVKIPKVAMNQYGNLVYDPEKIYGILDKRRKPMNIQSSGKALVALTESPTANILRWASKIYKTSGNIDYMTSRGFYDEKVWKSIYFQMISALYTLQLHGYVINNMTLQDHIYIKDLQTDGNNIGYWKYIIDQIEYYIPNYGYMVLIDSNFKDLPVPDATVAQQNNSDFLKHKILSAQFLNDELTFLRKQIDEENKKQFPNQDTINNLTKKQNDTHTYIQNKLQNAVNALQPEIAALNAQIAPLPANDPQLVNLNYQLGKKQRRLNHLNNLTIQPAVVAVPPQPPQFNEQKMGEIFKTLVSDDENFKNFKNLIDPANFGKNFTNDDGVPPPETFRHLLQTMFDEVKEPTAEKNIGYYLKRYFGDFLHNRIGDYLNEMEKQKLAPMNMQDFKVGEMLANEDQFGNFKWVLYSEIKLDPQNNQEQQFIVERKFQTESIPRNQNSYRKYTPPYKIEQASKPNEKLSEDDLLDTYTLINPFPET